MSRINWFTALVSLLPHALVSSATADYHPCQGWVAPSPPPKPRVGDSVNNGYGGMVTEVTKDSITIQWVNTKDEKPKKFAVCETLAAGKPGIVPRPIPNSVYTYSAWGIFGYRLADVKVGDCVSIFYARIDGVDICDHISIKRRPDGEVPPLPKEAEDLLDQREVWKAKHPGKPLPDYFADRPYVPYHERLNAYWARIAPMPREVKVGPPSAP